MEAPERIWAEPDYDHGWSYPRGEWSTCSPCFQDDAYEYVRADIHDALAARLAEVERERDRMEAEAVVAMDRWHQSQARAERLEAALRGLTEHYVAMVNSGDCGFWNPEEDPEVIAARAELQQEGGATDTPPPAPSPDR
jgi:hypothetical protein